MAKLKQISILVAKNIKRLRGDKEWTQEKTAERAKMHLKFYQRLENTTGLNRASMLTLSRLSEVFKAHPSEFFLPIKKKS